MNTPGTDRAPSIAALLLALALAQPAAVAGTAIEAPTRTSPAGSRAGVTQILYTAAVSPRPSTAIVAPALALAAPVLSASLLAASPDTFPDGTATIPFELLEGLILLRADAMGADADTSGDFVLDTGAGFLALNSDLADVLGLLDSTNSRGAVGIAARPLQRLVLGNQSLDRVQPVLTIDGAIIRRVTDRVVLGLLGTKLYDDRVVQIDYVGRKLRLIPAASPGDPSSGNPPGSESRAASADPTTAVAHSLRTLSGVLGANARAVPFELAGDGKILIRVRLGVSRFASSRPLTLILDTGATKSVLFRSALSSLGIDFQSWPSLCGLSVPTLFGAPSACLVRMPRAHFEAFAFEAAAAGGAAESSDGEAAAGAGAAAQEPGAETKPSREASAPTTTRRVRPAVRAMLGTPKERDSGKTGAAGSVPATTAGGAGDSTATGAAPATGVTPSTEATPSQPVAAAGGLSAAPALRAVAVRADDLDAIVMDSELQGVLSEVVKTPVHGLLGYTLLRNYRVTIDYPRRVVWLEPAADPDPRPFEYSHPGIQLERDGSILRIVAVAEGSPAAKAKLAVGDTLESVDSQPVEGRALMDVARMLEGEPGSRVTLSIGNATGRRTVTLTRRRLL